MKVETLNGDVIALGVTEIRPTVGIVDYSRRETDDFGTTTLVRRGFSRTMSVRFALPFDAVATVRERLADLRATKARYTADDRYRALSVTGLFKDFDIDVASQPQSYCTLTVEGLTQTDIAPDTGGDPAIGGQASTFRMVSPAAVTEAVLGYSSVPEDDAPAWAAGVTYAQGARVLVAHRVYESLIPGNVGNDPAASGKWVDTGPANRWRMFDEALGTATSAAGQIVVTLNPESVNAVALLDVVGATVRVQVPGYDRTAPVGSDGTALFLDLPMTGGPGNLSVTIDGSGTVAVGTMLIGRLVALGVTEASPTAGITDYSRKDVDDFGEVTIVPRAWSKRMEARTLIRADALDAVFDRLASVRARNSLWIGDPDSGALTTYGFVRDFSIEVDDTTAKVSLSIEGMSEAAKRVPFRPGLTPDQERALAAVQADLASLLSDDVLTRGSEKLTLLRIYDDVSADAAAAHAQSLALHDRYGGDPTFVQRRALDEAMGALNAYLNGLGPPWSNVDIDTPADGQAVRERFKAARIAIADLDRANEDFLAARTKDALEQIVAIGSDAVLSRGEKPEVRIRWDEIYNETESLYGRFIQLGQPAAVQPLMASMMSARDSLSDMLSNLAPPWTDASQDSPIDAALWQQRWQNALVSKATARAKMIEYSATTAQWDGVGNKPYSRLFKNLLDDSSWVPGAANTIGRFEQNGVDGQNFMGLTGGPSGISEPVLRMEAIIGQNGGDGDPAGGWAYGLYADRGEYDHRKTYRYMTWVWREPGASGLIYFGCAPAFNMNGDGSDNPYFWVGDVPQPHKWYLMVGTLHGSAYRGPDSGTSGLYDPDTGIRVSPGADWRSVEGATLAVHRAYQFYSRRGSVSFFARPSLEEVTSATISVEQIFATVGMTSVEAAQLAAARNELAAIGSDAVLSRGEKERTTREWVAILSEAEALYQRFLALGEPADIQPAMAAFLNARDALGAYLASLSPPWTDSAMDTPIDPPTWANRWDTLYDRMAKARAAITGRKGDKGDAAPLVRTQWSINGSTNWHDSYFGADRYYRQSNDGGATWGPAILGVGEDGARGADGSYIDSRFRYSSFTGEQPDPNPNPFGYYDAPTPTQADGVVFSERDSYIGGDSWMRVEPGEVYRITGYVQARATIWRGNLGMNFAGNPADGSTYAWSAAGWIDGGQEGPVDGTVTVPAGKYWMRPWAQIGATDNFGTLAYNYRLLNPPPLWLSKVKRNADGSLAGQWSKPVRISGRDGQDGTSALAAYLSNENFTIATDAAGNPGAFSAAVGGGQMRVFFGLDDVTAACTFTIQAGEALEIGLAPNGTYGAGILHADNGYVFIVASYQGQTIAKRLTASKSRAGANGNSPPIVTLTASDQSFSLDTNGNQKAKTVRLSALAQNSNAQVLWALYREDGAVLVNWTDSVGLAAAGGATRHLDYLNIELTAGTFHAILAGNGGESLTYAVRIDGTEVRDTVSIVRLRDGAKGEDGQSALSAYLTNEAFTHPTNAAGLPHEIGGAIGNGQMRVFLGTDDVTSQCTFTAQNPAFLALIVDQFGAYQAQALYADTGYAIVIAVYNGQTITKRVTATKAKGGTDGADGTSPPLLTVIATDQSFSQDTNGATRAKTIRITALPQNSGGAVLWRVQKEDGTPLLNYTTAQNLADQGYASQAFDSANIGVSAAVFDALLAQAGGTTLTYVAALAGTSASDAVSIVRLRDGAKGADGAPGMAAYLTNQQHTVPADAFGNVTSYAGTDTSIVVMAGGQNVTAYFALEGFDNPQGLTVPGAFPNYSVTGGLDAAEPSATATFNLLGSGPYAGIRLKVVYSLSKSKAGADGTAPPLISIQAGSSTIVTNADGSLVTNSNFLFSATRQNTGAGIEWRVFDGAGTAHRYYAGDTYLTDAADLLGIINYPGGIGQPNTRFCTVHATCAGVTDVVSVYAVKNGATGQSGTSPFALDLGSYAVNVNATYNGQTKPGQLPRNVSVSVKQGTSDAIGAVTIGVSTSPGIAATYANGALSVTDINADGYIEVSATQGGVPVVAPKRIAVSRTLDPAPPATNTGQTISGGTGNSASTSYPTAPSVSIATIQTPANGVMPVTIFAEYFAETATSGVDRTFSASFKVVYRPAGSGGAWSDLGPGAAGSLAVSSRLDDSYSGTAEYSGSVTLAGNSAYEFAVLFRKSGGNSTASYVGITTRIGA